MTTAAQWVERLRLVPHPEGGHYRQVYRSAEVVPRAALPPRFGGDHVFSTAIYFLLQGQDFSALHRIKQDEVWHFYAGSSLTVHVFDPDGTHRAIRLGTDWGKGEEPQAVVRAGRLFGAILNDPKSYALVGCTVAPGFDFADMEMPGREELCRLYPQHREVIERLTR